MKLDRYQRHSLIDWFSQDALKAARFAVIGCGAVGNEVAKNLALLGVGAIDLYDLDEIEIHNLTRSVLFRETDVGQSKVEVASRRLVDLDPHVSVSTFHGDFWDKLTFGSLRAYDGVFCCVDNFEARIRLNELCRIASVNLVNTGIDSRFAVVEIFPFRRVPTCACYECNLPETAYESIRRRYSCGWLKRVSYVEKKVPTTIITSSMAGALAVSAGLNLLRQTGEADASRIFLDTFAGRSSRSTLSVNGHCPACSKKFAGVHVLPAQRLVSDRLFAQFPANGGLTVTTSEPIVVSYRCVNCEPNPGAANILFERASAFDAGMSHCPRCSKESVSIEISDSFALGEMLERFHGRRIPCKYLTVELADQLLVLEMED